ncbi:MAG: zinc ABC transporter substrate-binding protein [Gammaproteobacteria bacterium]|nr:zinc ABC transporter substrate-binding protein [Gammaproteobacteria bacterium]
MKTILLSCLYFLTPFHAVAEPPSILVTLKPIHSLVSNLTRGITQPRLLIDGIQSPHDFQLKPSDRRKIAHADIIVYVSDSIESYIPEISNTFNEQQMVIAVDKMPGIKLLAARSTDEHSDHHHHHSDIDGHIWLSIDNAKAISHHLYTELISHDPEHQTIYLQNKNQLIEKLQQLKSGISDKLSTVKQKPYLTFHDAFQYFESEFELTGSHFVTSSPEHISGIQSIRRLKKLIYAEHINCIYYEPPQLPGIVHTLKENTSAHTLPLDPVGTGLQPGEDLYFELLDTIASQLGDCLK